MNTRIIAAIVCTSLFAITGCASTTPTAAAPSPVVAFAVPARVAQNPAPSRFELTGFQMQQLNASTRPLTSHK